MVMVWWCRNESKGKAALDQLITEQPADGHIDLVVGDLGTVTSVYKLGQELYRNYEKVDALLMHNAGISWPPSKMKLNEDVMVNHLASFIVDLWVENRVCKRGLYNVKGNFDIEKTPLLSLSSSIMIVLRVSDRCDSLSNCSSRFF
jgi:hypothetical protein